MGKCSKSDVSHLRARAGAHGDGVRHPDFKQSERALALWYLSLGFVVNTAAQAHEVLPQAIRNWQKRGGSQPGRCTPQRQAKQGSQLLKTQTIKTSYTSQPRGRSERQTRSWQRPGPLQLSPRQFKVTSSIRSRSSG